MLVAWLLNETWYQNDESGLAISEYTTLNMKRLLGVLQVWAW